MKHLTLQWHIDEFITDVKTHIHLRNIFKVKGVIIGGAGLKILYTHFLAGSLVTAKTMLVNAGVGAMLFGVGSSISPLNNTLAMEACVEGSQHQSQLDCQTSCDAGSCVLEGTDPELWICTACPSGDANTGSGSTTGGTDGSSTTAGSATGDGSGECQPLPISCGSSVNCGIISDGCGGTISCGTCSSGNVCSNNTCVPSGGTTSGSTTAGSTPTNGSCGLSFGACNVGSPTSLNNTSCGSNDTWTCSGNSGGASESCSVSDPCPSGGLVEICTNVIDDDSDGLIDCADSDCANSSNCNGNGAGTGCSTTIDCAGVCGGGSIDYNGSNTGCGVAPSGSSGSGSSTSGEDGSTYDGNGHDGPPDGFCISDQYCDTGYVCIDSQCTLDCFNYGGDADGDGVCQIYDACKTIAGDENNFGCPQNNTQNNIYIYGISLSNVDVIRGAKNVDLIMFEVETDDDTTGTQVSSFRVKGDIELGSTSSLDIVDENVVSTLKLWKKVSSGWELLEEQSGFNLSNEYINFQNFGNVSIPASSTQLFLITADITNSEINVGSKFSFELTEASIFNVQAGEISSELCGSGEGSLCGGPSINSRREIYVSGAGEINIKVDNYDSSTNRSRHVLAGTEPTDFFVASFELIAINEGVEIEDMLISVQGPGASNFEDAVVEVVIYANDRMTELYRETVSGTPILLNNINLFLPEGSSNIYVNVVADAIGKNTNGMQIQDVQLALSVSEVVGNDSGVKATILYEGLSGGFSSNSSRPFDIIPVHISDIKIANNNGTIEANQLTEGENILGVIEVTTDSWTTTNVIDNSDVEVTFEGGQLAFTIHSNETVSAVTIERIDITGGDRICDTTKSDTTSIDAKFTVDFSSCDDNVAEIEEGSTAKYRVKATIPTITNQSTAYAQIKFNDLNNGDVAYKSTDVSSIVISELRLSKTTVFGDKKYTLDGPASNGTCGVSLGECSGGSAFNVNDTSCGTNDTRTCLGVNGGSSASCSKVDSCPVDPIDEGNDLSDLLDDLHDPAPSGTTYSFAVENPTIEIIERMENSVKISTTTVIKESSNIIEPVEEFEIVYHEITNMSGLLGNLLGWESYTTNRQSKVVSSTLINGSRTHLLLDELQPDKEYYIQIFPNFSENELYDLLVLLTSPSLTLTKIIPSYSTPTNPETPKDAATTIDELFEKEVPSINDPVQTDSEKANMLLEYIRRIKRSTDAEKTSLLSSLSTKPVQLQFITSIINQKITPEDAAINATEQHKGYIEDAIETIEEIRKYKLQTAVTQLTETKKTEFTQKIELLKTELGDDKHVKEILEHIDTPEKADAFVADTTTFIKNVRVKQFKERVKDLSRTKDDSSNQVTQIDQKISDTLDMPKSTLVNIINDSLKGDTAAKAIIESRVSSKLGTKTSMTQQEALDIIDELNTDSDKDSIADIVEDSAPNNGDANFDGTQDSQQDRVGTVPSATSDIKMTIDTQNIDGCNDIVSFDSTSETVLGDDGTYSYPAGLNEFELNCSSATIRVFYHGIIDSTNLSYRKFSKRQNRFIDLPATFGQRNGVVYAEFTIIDGSEFDDSPAGDGRIVDPSGPVTGGSTDGEDEEETTTVSRGGGSQSSIGSDWKNTSTKPSTYVSSYKRVKQGDDEKAPNSLANISDTVYSAKKGSGRTGGESEHGSASSSIVGPFEALLSLPVLLQYENSSIFAGNNLSLFMHIYEYTIKLDVEKQRGALQRIVRNLKMVDKSKLASYKIDKGVVTVVLELIAGCKGTICDPSVSQGSEHASAQKSDKEGDEKTTEIETTIEVKEGDTNDKTSKNEDGDANEDDDADEKTDSTSKPVSSIEKTDSKTANVDSGSTSIE